MATSFEDVYNVQTAELTRRRAENEALIAERDALRADAATLAWIRAEHDRPDPLIKCVIKAGRDRSGHEWAEFIDGYNFAELVASYARIDAAIAAQEGKT